MPLVYLPQFVGQLAADLGNPLYESFPLYYLAKVILEYAAIPIPRSADHDIAKSDILVYT